LSPSGARQWTFRIHGHFWSIAEIDKIAFSLDKIEKSIVDVNDADVDRVIEQLCKQYTKWNVVDRPATEKDRVVLDYYAIFDGKSDIDNKIQDFPLELGAKMMMPGFEDALVGIKAVKSAKFT